MKEATGELNMTVITVVAIAAVAAFFYAFVWPNIKGSINRSQKCSNAINCDCSAGGSTCPCEYCEGEDCSNPETINCPNPDKKTGGGSGGQQGGQTS